MYFYSATNSDSLLSCANSARYSYYTGTLKSGTNTGILIFSRKSLSIGIIPNFLGRHRYGRPHNFLNDAEEEEDPLSSFFCVFFSFASFYFFSSFNHICG